MQKITNFRIWLTVTITAILIAGGYEIRSLGVTFGGIPSYIVAVASLVLGGKMAAIVVDRILSIRSVRAKILSSAHIEGYWYLTTSQDGNSPLNKDGILYIEHQPTIGETRVVTTRVDESSAEFPTVSEIAYVRTEGIDNTYLNYFRLTYPGPDTKFGMSAGRFIKSDDLSPHPNLLESHIIVTGEGIVRRQSARRIDDIKIAALKAKYGVNWKAKALTTEKSSIFI